MYSKKLSMFINKPKRQINYPISSPMSCTMAMSQVRRISPISSEKFSKTYNLVFGFIRINYDYNCKYNYIPNDINSIILDYYHLMTIYKAIPISCLHCKSVGNIKVQCKSCSDCNCDATGKVGMNEKCFGCNGSGIDCYNSNKQNRCMICKGDGYFVSKCNVCKGLGIVYKHVNIVMELNMIYY